MEKKAAPGGKTSKKKKETRTEGSLSISTLHEKKFYDEGINIQDLIGSLKDTVKNAAIEKQISKLKFSKRALPVALEKFQADKLNREVGYEHAKKNANKWVDVVESVRSSDHLEFPLRVETVKLNSELGIRKKTKPGTELERQVMQVLKGSDHYREPGQELTPAEESVIQAMDLEDAVDRRLELMQLRNRFNYAMIKAARQKKIKSKKYRSILRKEKRRREEQEEQAEIAKNPKLSEEKQAKVDRQRIFERMTLRHSNTTRWAKYQITHQQHNEKTKEALKQQLEIRDELRRKTKMPEADPLEQEEGESEEEPLEWTSPWDEPTIPQDVQPQDGEVPKGYRQLYKTVDEYDKKERKRKSEETALTGISKKLGKKSLIRKKNQEVEEIVPDLSTDMDSLFSELEKYASDSSSEDEETPQKVEDEPEGPNFKVNTKSNLIMSTKRKTKLEDFDNMDGIKTITGLGSFLPISTDSDPVPPTTGRRKKEEKKEELNDDLLDVTKIASVKKSALSRIKAPKEVVEGDIFGQSDDEGEEDAEQGDEDEGYLNAVSEAFEDDDIIEDFKTLKEKKIEEGQPKDIDISLPGWGSWGGKGIEPRKDKDRFIIKAPKGPPRKDLKIGHVIISEFKNKKFVQHQVKQVPTKFSSVDEFERSLKNPIGKEWNTPSAFQSLIEPKITTKKGKMIEPMSKDTLICKETAVERYKRKLEEQKMKNREEAKKKRFETKGKNKGVEGRKYKKVPLIQLKGYVGKN